MEYQTYISLLRGINVSGKNKIKMDALKSVYSTLGFSNVHTYIQSGNVLFSCSPTDTDQLEEKIELGIQSAFGFDIPVLVNTLNDFKNIISAAPFTDEEENKRYVTFLKKMPDFFPEAQINNAKQESEMISIGKKYIYIYCPGGYGRTKLSNSFFEKKLKGIATTRNWKTVQTLVELAQSL